MASKHERLAATLRKQISDGIYGPGDRLPSESTLMEQGVEQGKVSRTTVRTALTTLKNEGLISAESGVGYTVRQADHIEYRPQGDFRRASTTPEAERFTGATRVADDDLRQDITVQFVPAPSDVARRLGIGEGEFVALRSRNTFRGAEPYQLIDSYYPRDVVEDSAVMRKDDIPEGVNRLLAELGHAQVRAFDEIWIRMPHPEEADRLRTGLGVPVAEHVITGLTAEGRAVRMVRAIIPGDRNVITFDRVHPDAEEARC